jgi:hypothetical protein
VGRRIEVNRENLRKLFDTQGPKRDSKTLKKTVGMLPICFIDLP